MGSCMIHVQMQRYLPFSFAHCVATIIVFKLFYNNIISCIVNGHYLCWKDPDGEFWCSTRVNRRTREHIGGKGHWGYCKPGCETKPKPKETNQVYFFIQLKYLMMNLISISSNLLILIQWIENWFLVTRFSRRWSDNSCSD